MKRKNYLLAVMLLFLLISLPSAYGQQKFTANDHSLSKVIKKSITLQSSKGEPLAYGNLKVNIELTSQGNKIKQFYLSGANLRESHIYWLYIDSVLITSKQAFSDRDETQEVPTLVFDYSNNSNGKTEGKLFSLLNDTIQTNHHVELLDQEDNIVLWGDFSVTFGKMLEMK